MSPIDLIRELTDALDSADGAATWAELVRRAQVFIDAKPVVIENVPMNEVRLQWEVTTECVADLIGTTRCTVHVVVVPGVR